jgi:hypothetical protein
MPEVWTILGALAGIVTTCGLTALLAEIARRRGRHLQAISSTPLGPETTATLLTHADPSIDPLTKRRYHDALRANGLDIPTAAEEADQPQEALARFRACASWLLAASKRQPKLFPLLPQENISYGFRRNLWGLKPAALCAVIGALALNTYFLWARHDAPDHRYWAGAAVQGLLLLGLAAWIWLITLDFVADASRAFAERLLAGCDQLGATPTEPAG